MTAVEFRIIGPLEVRAGASTVEIAGARQRALLALLLLHAGQVVSTDRLLDEVWGDRQPEAGATALRVRISHLRKALGPAGALLVTRPPGYALALCPGQLDLERFERLTAEGEAALGRDDPAAATEALAAALALWRGPPLADIADVPFAQAAVARLEDLRLAATELRIEADLRLGRHARLIAELRALVREHPLRERPRAQLMLALYRDGRQAEALAAFAEARRALVEEIGLEPGPELQELDRRILAQDPALGLAAPAARSVGPSPAPPAARRVLALPSSVATIDALARIAEPLARAAGRELVVAVLVADGRELALAIARLHALRASAAARGVEARVAAFTSPDRAADAVRLAAEEDVAVLLVEAEDGVPDDGGRLAAVLGQAVCDVALVAGAQRTPRGAAVLVPFGGHDHDWAAVELGAWFAGVTGAPLRFVGGRGDALGGRRDASRLLSSASLATQRALGVAAEPLLAAPGADGLVAASAEAALVVAGLSDRWPHEGLGAVRLDVARRAATPVVLVRRGLRPGGLAPAHALTRFTWSAG